MMGDRCILCIRISIGLSIPSYAFEVMPLLNHIRRKTENVNDSGNVYIGEEIFVPYMF